MRTADVLNASSDDPIRRFFSIFGKMSSSCSRQTCWWAPTQPRRNFLISPSLTMGLKRRHRLPFHAHSFIKKKIIQNQHFEFDSGSRVRMKRSARRNWENTRNQFHRHPSAESINTYCNIMMMLMCAHNWKKEWENNFSGSSGSLTWARREHFSFVLWLKLLFADFFQSLITFWEKFLAQLG